MDTIAVVLKGPGELGVQHVSIDEPTDSDVVIDVMWSGISTGTERLLYSGRMPPFPGMGYPLVPGYETVGRVTYAGKSSARAKGELVFAAGSTCFKDVRALFGGSAKTLVIPAQRAVVVPEEASNEYVLLALAATAHHAIAGGKPPELIVGHGTLGRLLARICIALGHPPPVVWERDEGRMSGGSGYTVRHPNEEAKAATYGNICDVSGDAKILDALISHLKPGGEITLAGFYCERPSFDFPGAFMREARFRVAAQWSPSDLESVMELVRAGSLSLCGLVSHTRPAAQAAEAYNEAFNNQQCLKMVLDWREESL